MAGVRRVMRSALAAVLVLVALAGLTGCNQQDGRDATAPASTTISRVRAERVREWMDEGVPVVAIDARSEQAWSGGATRASGAVRVSPSDIEPYLSDVPRDRRLIVYCT